jgi:hypothetical protein
MGGAIPMAVGSTRYGKSPFLAAGHYVEGDLPRVILSDFDSSSVWADRLPMVAEALDAAIVERDEPADSAGIPIDIAASLVSLAPLVVVVGAVGGVVMLAF